MVEIKNNQSIGMKLVLALDYDVTIARTIEALKSEGFGILTEIDVKETMKKKLGVEYLPYKILGACNPPLAHRALQVDAEAGLLLPCNVTVRQLESGHCEVSLVDPLAMLGAISNPELGNVAREARSKLEKVALALEQNTSS